MKARMRGLLVWLPMFVGLALLLTGCATGHRMACFGAVTQTLSIIEAPAGVPNLNQCRSYPPARLEMDCHWTMVDGYATSPRVCTAR